MNMANNKPENGELQALIAAVCDGRASDLQLEELSVLLKSNPAALDEYLRYVDMHAALADETLPRIESNLVDYRPARESQPKSSRYSWIIGLAATVLVLGSLYVAEVAKTSVRDAGETELLASPATENALRVATVLLSEDCVWTGANLVEGQRLTVGQFGLSSGTAVLRTDSGAELVVVGPAEINLLSPARASVHRGDVMVRVTDGGEGFSLLTPTSEVIDLGTEFAVKVDAGGATEVHVLDGEVSYRELQQKPEQVHMMHAGEAIASSTDGRPSRSVPMNSPRFHELVNRINPGSRTDLLTVYEGFHYSAGVLPLAESTAGKGWSGPWRQRLPRERVGVKPDETPDDLQIVHGEMDVSWPVPGGRLGMLKLLPGTSVYVREMKAGVDLDKDGVTYISFMLRQIETPEAKSSASSLYLTLCSSDDFDDGSITLGHGNSLLPVIQSIGGARFTSPVRMHGDEATLWIAKIVARKNGDDEIYLRVFSQADSVDYAEPAIWHVVSRGLRLSDRFDRVVMRVSGEHAQLIDELRIGPTWRSAAPIRNSNDAEE